jgi:hypothetical protein
VSLITPGLRACLDERVDDSALHPAGWVALVPAGPLTPDGCRLLGRRPAESLKGLAADLAERLSLPCHLPDARDGLGGLDPEDVTLVFDDGASAELWLERVPASSEAIQEAQEMCQPCALARYRASSDWCIDGEYQYTHGHPPEGSLECPRHRGEDPYMEGDTETLEVGAAALGLRPLRMPALLAETAETAPVLALVHREAVEQYEAWEATRWEVQA